MFCSYFFSMMMLGLHAHRLDIMFMVMSCLDLCVCMHVLCSLHVSCYFPCACAFYAIFACLDLGYVCHAICYWSLIVSLSFFIVFWFRPDLDLMVFVIVHTPWPISKGLNHPFCISMLACFYALCFC